jgi:uncharacterized membrane protein required for colicin V production
VSAADVVFALFVLYGLIFGLRRGLYKELIAITALVVAAAVARTWHDPAGDFIHSTASFVPLGLAHAVGAALLGAVVFFFVTLVGRLVLKKVRDPDAQNGLEKAAAKTADAVEGDSKMGPVTLLTNPIASAQRGFVYWSDKILGGVLGVVKGAVAAYLLFAVVYFVDSKMGNLGGLKDSIARSQAAVFYNNYLDSLMQKLPEYRFIEGGGSSGQASKDPGSKPAPSK